METAADYLERTESAARKLFEGIESYLERLQRAVPPVFVSSGANRQQADVELEAWKKRHDTEIKASLAAQREYFAGPLGLVILAGRNQHMHFGETQLWEPNLTVFERLAIYHDRNTDPAVRDPAFDLGNSRLVSFAHNIAALIGWRSFDDYQRDLRELLKQ